MRKLLARRRTPFAPADGVLEMGDEPYRVARVRHVLRTHGFPRSVGVTAVGRDGVLVVVPCNADGRVGRTLRRVKRLLAGVSRTVTVAPRFTDEA